MVYLQTQERASDLLREMVGENMAVDLLHASKSKQQRDATIDAFRTGKVSSTLLGFARFIIAFGGSQLSFHFILLS